MHFIPFINSALIFTCLKYHFPTYSQSIPPRKTVSPYCKPAKRPTESFRPSASLQNTKRKVFCLLQVCKTPSGKFFDLCRPAKHLAESFLLFASVQNAKQKVFTCFIASAKHYLYESTNVSSSL